MRRLAGRAVAVALASASIVTLVLALEGVLTLRAGVMTVLAPATAALAWWCCRDRALRGDVLAGAVAGVIAAIAYDLFRAPFVLHGMPLYRPFARFGALITGRDDVTGLAVGWAYHFSNGMALGAMYALIARRWPWPLAIAWAIAIEVGLLALPYASFIGVEQTRAFVAVTMAAHLVFGVVLGLALRAMGGPPLPPTATRVRRATP